MKIGDKVKFLDHAFKDKVGVIIDLILAGAAIVKVGGTRVLVMRDNLKVIKDKCEKCKEMIVAHAFSDGECKICGDKITSPHIPAFKVCEKCAIENNLCKQCGEPL